MSEEQADVAARVPGAAALGLLAPPSAAAVPATALADPAWVAGQLARRSALQGTDDVRTVAAVWWYSVSAVLLTPPLAGLVVGRPLSARAEDTTLAVLPSGLPVAATSSSPSEPSEVGPGLRDSLSAAITCLAAVAGGRPAPLWAVAADSLATRLLALGRAVGDVGRATALAAPLAAAVGAPLPVPRYVDVAGVRFVHRVSCCQVYRLPGEVLCTSCPRRPPAQRQVLLEDAAVRM